MEQTKKPRKIVTVGVLIGVAIFATAAIMSYNTPTIKIADADEIESFKAQLELLNKTAMFHQEVLQQHNMQIRQITNNTVIIAQWAEDFSKNTNNRLDILENKK